MQETTMIDEETTQEQECADPGFIANADRQHTHFAHGGEVYFTCDAGFCAKGQRTRTVILQCRGTKWSQAPPSCVECDACSAPIIPENNHISAIVNPDYTATLTCDDGFVMEAGQDFTDMTINCIEGGKWAEEIAACHRPAQVVCGEDHMTVVIDKNMMRSMGWTGGAESLSLTGENTAFEQFDPECLAKEDDAGENYVFSLKSPFTKKCRTKFEAVGDDYKFSNKVVWKHNQGAFSKTATLLDFDCIYQGIFITSLQNPIKLAISTRTYYTEANEPFTVSMAIFHQSNYTGLVDNVPILHRGKRYFVELLLHEQEKGTPFLKKCYGSSSYLSEAELKKIGQKSQSSQMRTMIQEGCPEKRTLVRLEVAPNDHTRRYSFMFPKINVGIAELQFVYLHCELELKPIGTKPSCFRQNDQSLRQGGRSENSRPNDRFKQGINGRSGLGGRQYFLREYGQSAENYVRNKAPKNNGANNLDFGNMPALDLPSESDFNQGEAAGGMAGLDFGDQPDQMNIINGRKKRSAIEESLDIKNGDFNKLHDWPVSFGPCIIPRNETENEEQAETANVGLLEKLMPQELYSNNEEQVDPQGEIVEILEEAIEEIEDEQEQAAATKMVIMIACILVGGIVVFAIATMVGFKTDICAFEDNENSSPKKTKHFKVEKSGPEPVVKNKPVTMDELAKRMQQQCEEEGNSCGTSMTSADTQ
jgi:hypothetical protein